MSDTLAIIINILYLVLACIVLRFLKLPFIQLNTWTYTWAGLFLASIFFIAGLLLFDIPLGFLGGNNPYSIQRMKEVWWAFPLFFFIAFLVSLNLRTIVAYVRGKLKRDKAKARLFASCGSVMVCFLLLILVVWFQDPEIGTPTFGNAILLFIFWTLGTGLMFVVAIATKTIIKSNQRK